MTFYVRKLNKAKWCIDPSGGSLPANADAITNCLKTSRNTLSFWLVDSMDHVDEAVLAIVASNDNLDSIDIVVVPESYLIEKGIEIQATAGHTACSDLVNAHRDLANLNVKHLDVLSEYIVNQLQSRAVKRYTLSKLREILTIAVDNGRIAPDQLSEGVRKKIFPVDSTAA